MNGEAVVRAPSPTHPADGTFWRVEGSLLNFGAVRPVAFFTWNSQRFSERWARRGGVGLLALFRPLFYSVNRVLATRVLHTLLRGVSQDRLDLLGEEYFHYVLQPNLKARGVEKLRDLMSHDSSVILVSQGLDHVMRPLAEYLGVGRLVANRLEFRDGLATGRLLSPVIRPRGGLARLTGRNSDGRTSPEKLALDLGLEDDPQALIRAAIPAKRSVPKRVAPIVNFGSGERLKDFSVRESLAGKHILLIGATGFIGKVWLAKVLTDVPEIGRIYLLIRPGKSTSARQRFERIVQESPVFEAFHERLGGELGKFLGDRIEVLDGDIRKAGLGMPEDVRKRVAARLDLVINSAGLTDFNPDLRSALAVNVDATVHILDFLSECDHAGLLHLSTCYVAGSKDGRIAEELIEDYTPARIAGFDVERERQELHALIGGVEASAQTPEVTAKLVRQIRSRGNGSQQLDGAALENHIRKLRSRWIRNELIELGMRRAKQFGWPNTYTFTKALAESLIARRAGKLRVAAVRPSIVETSTTDPFQGWNEGVNTSAPISYLLGTYFRQLPSNERKCLDLIPVDLVCRGMTLIAAAIVQGVNERVYQLATSASNPCDMRRSVELTGLAHRKHYRAQESLQHRFRARFDSIPVSKERYLRLSAPGQKAVVQAIQRMSAPLPLKRPPLASIERGLDRVEKLIELYEPFILHNQQVFVAQNIELLSAAVVEKERHLFGYDAGSIDWWEYWINIHIPALRKWSYPLIEGRQLEARPRREFHLPPQSEAAQVGKTERLADGMIGREAT